MLWEFLLLGALPLYIFRKLKKLKKMKKEVISYSSFSMAPPESVELLDNNKGTIINDSGEK